MPAKSPYPSSAIEMFLKVFLPPLVVFVVTVTAIQIAALALNQPFVLPTPTDVGRALWNFHGELLSSLWTTAQASLIGFAASLVFGIISAIAMASSSLIRRAFFPYTVFFQTVPIVAISPLLVKWVHAGLPAVAASSFIVSVFPVIANTLAGMLSTDPALEDLFRLYGGSAWARLFKLRLPSALPNVFTGLRVAAGLAVIGAIVAEFLVGLIGGDEGIGMRIMRDRKLGDADKLFAEVLVSSLLGLFVFAAINLAGKLLLKHWHASERE